MITIQKIVSIINSMNMSICKITDTEDNLFDDLPGDPDTLAGLILELAGRIPEAGFEVKFEKLDFVVESVDKRRIRRIRVKLPQVADTDE